MVEVKEPEIKLFGMKIVLPENRKKVVVVGGGESSNEVDAEISGGSDSDNRFCSDVNKASRVEQEEDAEKAYADKQNQHITEDRQCYESKPQEVESRNSNPTLEFDDPKTPKSEKDQSDGTNSQHKTLKKLDKILPCPRCKSMDTKFCYYNNYNVKQPRHFCRSCQRYWTAGGNTRNVPVGAGRRKNKNSASHYHNITNSEALQASQLDSPNGFHSSTFRPNGGTVLSFSPNSQICESMAPVLNLAEIEIPKGIQNVYYKTDQGAPISCKTVENRDDCCSASATTSKSTVEGGKDGSVEPVMQNINGFPYSVPCLPGIPWPVVPVPPICPAGFPMAFYPTPYWNVPWLSLQSPTPNQKASGFSPDSPLGKHSRDGKLLKPKKPENEECLEEKNSESSIVIPKTLRIDNPDEAARSPIWATLGIKYDSVRRGGLLKALQPKFDEKKPVATASPVMHANPAALSRSLGFQESA